MCGIAGLVKLKQTAVEAKLLQAMIGALDHRGPDDSGVFVDSNVGLAHARLSIIDLAGGHQPMSIENGSLWITFNGEIFNYIELREELENKDTGSPLDPTPKSFCACTWRRAKSAFTTSTVNGHLPSGIRASESCFSLETDTVLDRCSTRPRVMISSSPRRSRPS